MLPDKEKSIFPKQYQYTIETFLTMYWRDRVHQVQETALGVQIPHVTNDILYQSGFALELAEIARAAVGELERNDYNVGIINETIQSLCERLFAVPGLDYSYDIPVSFWSTELGQIVAMARLWQMGDELITLTEAAKILNIKLPSIKSKVDKGQLMAYFDPASPNPQKERVKLSRKEVEASVKRLKK